MTAPLDDAPRPAPTKPKRRTTKRLIIANMLAAWGALYLSIGMGDSIVEHTGMPLATIIVGLFGVYTGTGHLDLRAMAQILTRHDGGSASGGGDVWNP